jgi:hypothetical protein
VQDAAVASERNGILEFSEIAATEAADMGILFKYVPPPGLKGYRQFKSALATVC